jgi:hypothetical protein
VSTLLPMMTCPDCGERLDDVPVSQPCPQCGGLRRDASPTAQPATARMEVHRPTVAVGYNDPRPWTEKWQDVLEAFGKVKSAYKTKDGQGNEDVRRVVEDFFKTCRELGDWLWENTNINKSDVIGLIQRSPSLRLADAVAQTIKHHTRRRGKGDPITARVTGIRVGPDGASAEISWSRASGPRGSEDALDLARRCVKAWRGFLVRKGLA